MSDEVILSLAHDWREFGVEAGDVLLVHSNIRRTLYRIRAMGAKPHPTIILQSLVKALGPSGTLILPLFNFDFADGISFDIRLTKSQMGILTEIGRQHPDAVRTGHPIFSFAVIGKESNGFERVNNFSGYGEDSPFGILHELGGKMAVLDLADQDSMTFYHYVEERKKVDYRYHKTFTGGYIAWDGVEQEKTYGLFVRDVERGVKTHVEPMEEILWQQNLYRGQRPNVGCGMRVIEVEKLYDAVSEVIDSGRTEGILFRYEK